MESIRAVRVSADGKRVELELSSKLKPGYVYEFHLKPLAAEGSEFFPSEAYYTVLKLKGS